MPFVSEAEEVVEIVLLCAVEFAFAEVMRIFQALVQQLDSMLNPLRVCRLLSSLFARSLFCTLCALCLLCALCEQAFRLLHPADLILRRHFSFASFPGVELVGVELVHGLFVAADLIEQGNLFEHEVVAALDEGGVLLQEGQALGVGALQTFVELVQLHEYALVVLIKMEGTLHILHGFRLSALLVEASEGEIAPYGGELRVETCRKFPVLDGEVVLPLVVVEATEVVRRTGSVGVQGLGHVQHHDVLQTVGEAAVTVNLLSLFEQVVGSYGIALAQLCPPHIIIGKRMLYLAHAQYVDTFLPQPGLRVVEGQFMIVVRIAMHHLGHLLQQVLVLGQQILLVADAVVAGIQPQ